MEKNSSIPRRTFLTGSVMALGAVALLPAPALAVTAAEKQAEAAAALDSLNALQIQLDQASNNYFDALNEQQAAQDRMDEAQTRIDTASERITALQDQLGNRARSMYRNGSLSFLDLLLGATSFQAFTTNWDLLNQMNEDDASMVQETKDLRAQIEEEKAEYTRQEAIAKQKSEEAAAVKSNAEKLVDEAQQLYDNLTAEAAELLRQEEEARARAAAEAAARAEAEARARAEAAARKSGSSGKVDDSKVQTVTGNTVVDRAYSQLGKPYKWGASGPNSFDCSGLVGYCLTGKFGSHPYTTTTFMGWTRVSNPKPGDVCTNSHHCGVYIGGGRMIHAPRSGDVVKEAGVHSDMVYVRY